MRLRGRKICPRLFGGFRLPCGDRLYNQRSIGCRVWSPTCFSCSASTPIQTPGTILPLSSLRSKKTTGRRRLWDIHCCKPKASHRHGLIRKHRRRFSDGESGSNIGRMQKLTHNNGAVRSLSRRKLLALLSTGTAAVFLGCKRLRRSGEPKTSLTALATADAATMPSCVVRPEQTEGPYFIDEKLNRSDIRSDPSDGAIRPGVPLRLTFHVSRITGASCSPLSNAVVDI